MNPLNQVYSPEEIEEKTEEIFRTVLKKSPRFKGNPNFSNASALDLICLFDLYDKLFFQDFFKQKFSQSIQFRFSKRMTRAGGKTEYFRRSQEYAIVISAVLIFQNFKDPGDQVVVNGLTCSNRLEAVMRIMEHELVHLLELILVGNSSCKKKSFKIVAQNLFGHSGVTHHLIQAPRLRVNPKQVRVGDWVIFLYKGRRLKGIIARITRRATVMVPDKRGLYADSAGLSYSKFYVPLGLVTPSGDSGAA